MKLTTTKNTAENGIKVLVYGRSGVGKTRLIATAPRPILISAESGTLSLRGYDIPMIEIATMDDLRDAYLWTTGEEAKGFDTICIDSITELGEVVLANAKKNNKDVRKAYGELIDEMTQIIKSFRDMRGKHVYFSAQEERIAADDDTTAYGPLLPGSKLGPRLPYWYDEVFRMSIGKLADGTSYRYLLTQGDGKAIAKDRSGVLDEIEEPDLSKIFSKISAAVVAADKRDNAELDSVFTKVGE
jgi:NTP pyrophosphatase (non-canonical NTP hydrolase)